MASNVARTIRLFADRALSPAALSAHLVAAARQARDDLVRSGQASPVWRTFVDGREAPTEDGAQRVVSYRFSQLTQAVSFALAYAAARSPVRSGQYRGAWVVAVNGQLWSGELTAIPPGAEAFVVNRAPYARRLDAGGHRYFVPPGIVEATRQAVQRAFPTLRVEKTFLDLPHPYVLKAARGRRRDRQAGQAITYPAVGISEW